MDITKLKEFFIAHERKIMLSLLFILVSLNVFLLIFKFNNKEYIIEEENRTLSLEIDDINKESEEESKSTIFIDIKGEVTYPGVYEMEEGKRVIDSINLAGGLTDLADTTNINLSKILKDESVVIIEEYKENISTVSEKGNKDNNNISIENIYEVNTQSEKNESTNFENGIININEASLDQLMTLTGIGQSKAENIIKYREENNGFKSIDQLLEVKGIGESIYEKIKDFIEI